MRHRHQAPFPHVPQEPHVHQAVRPTVHMVVSVQHCTQGKTHHHISETLLTLIF